MISSVDESSLSNITKFSAPGLEPDVRLRVFNSWEFHVHSVILKLYSAFFRKFLDPPNKDNNLSVNESLQFRYEWVTEIDDDGEGWHLISESSIIKELDMENYTPTDPETNYWKRPEQQVLLFNKLLRAMYLQPYTVAGVKELIRLVELADYYCMLRVVSRTLDEPLINGPYIMREIEKPLAAVQLLPAAAKLRHRNLFNDCLMISLAPWSSFECSPICNTEFAKLAHDIRERVSAKVAKHAEAILSASINSDTMNLRDFNWKDQLIVDMRATTINFRNQIDPDKILPARYFSLMSKLQYGPSQTKMYSATCHEVLENNLFLLRHLTAGKDSMNDTFLFDSVREDEFPWDINAVDW